MRRIILKLLIIMAFFCTYNTADATTYTYDALDRLVKVVYGSGSDGTLSYIEYSYDEAGNITLINSLGGVFYGDIDASGSVNLADAILTLQLINGQEPVPAPAKKSDANADQKIGMEEAIYILQNISRLR